MCNGNNGGNVMNEQIHQIANHPDASVRYVEVVKLIDRLKPKAGARQRALLEAAEELLQTDWAEDCQECAIGKTDAWRRMKTLVLELKRETK